MPLLYRSMLEAADGLPVVGNTNGRQLGVRPRDLAAASGGIVQPGAGGVSVTPDDPAGLPSHRRPASLGAEGTDPVWVIDTDQLAAELTYRADPRSPSTHGFVEPSAAVTLVEYQQAIARTRHLWRKVTELGGDTT